MTNDETIKWLESLKAEIGKSEHRTLWHYAEAIDMAIEALSADTVSREEYEELYRKAKEVNEMANDILADFPSYKELLSVANLKEEFESAVGEKENE